MNNSFDLIGLQKGLKLFTIIQINSFRCTHCLCTMETICIRNSSSSSSSSPLLSLVQVPAKLAINLSIHTQHTYDNGVTVSKFLPFSTGSCTWLWPLAIYLQALSAAFSGFSICPTMLDPWFDTLLSQSHRVVGLPAMLSYEKMKNQALTANTLLLIFSVWHRCFSQAV